MGSNSRIEVGTRFQIARGQPWNYAPEAFQR